MNCNEGLSMDNEYLKDLYYYQLCLEQYKLEHEKDYINYIDSSNLVDDEVDYNNISYHLFPNDEVYYYTIVKEKKCYKQKTCVYSGARIYKDSNYYSFKVFLYNKTRNQTFVTKEFPLEINSGFEIPSTLHDFENLLILLENPSMDLNDEFNDLSVNTNEMTLTRLR